MTLFIYIKRCLKHFTVCAMLLLIPLTALALYDVVVRDDAVNAIVGIYAPPQNTAFIDSICENKSGYIVFKQYTDVDKMKRDVSSQRLECGFVLPNFSEMTEIEKGSIICGNGKSSVLSPISCEAVFGALLKVYGGNGIAMDFLESTADKEKFNNTYNMYLNEIDSPVIFEEVEVNKTVVAKFTDKAVLVDCWNGFLLLLAGIFGTNFWLQDKKRGINLSNGSDNITAMLLLFSVSIIIEMLIFKLPLNYLRIFLLDMGIWGGCCILSKIIKDSRWLWIFVPFVFMLVLAFDVVNISSHINRLKFFNYLLITHYYVFGTLPQLLTFSVLLCLCGIILKKIKKCA